MASVLNANIPKLKTFDASTGYLDIPGFMLIAESMLTRIEKADLKVRLLVGTDLLAKQESFETVREEPTLVQSLNQEELGEKVFGGAGKLLKFIGSNNVEIKKTNGRFNHSKCYFINDGVLVGSSNLTGKGLEGNYELNAGVYGSSNINEAGEWFENVWKISHDAKKDIERMILESKFGRPARPYDVYMKMLFETYRDILKTSEKITISNKKLADFQQDAVKACLHIISKHNGAIIADATGLGKTNMAIEIIRQKLFENKRVLVIAPAQILKTVWDNALREEGLPRLDRLSSESIGTDKFLTDPKKYSRIDFVVVDESHGFRSKSAKKRINLMEMLGVGRRKQVLLMTATPINNSVMDLYYQLSLITNGREDFFWDKVGIPHLEQHMKSAKDLDTVHLGLEKIQLLLDQIMVRRTRTYIERAFPNGKINGKKIQFPKHEYKKIDYRMGEEYEGIFSDMLKNIEALNMAPYKIDYYDRSLVEEERDDAQHRGRMQKSLIFKRFESSKAAMSVSIENRLKLYNHVYENAEKGRMVKLAEFRKLITKYRPSEISEDDGDEDSTSEKQFESSLLSLQNEQFPANFDKSAFMEDLEADLKILNTMKEDLSRVLGDAKLDAVLECLKNDDALNTQSKKVLIFTEFTTTANYLKKHIGEWISKKYPGKRVSLMTGDLDADARQKIIKEFAPKSNTVEEDDAVKEETDILVSTEVLSEGQNLQDCNYVLNYDLPWNPMRIVQRIGRVDRLTSAYPTIRTRACFPTQELDDILKLIHKIYGKIRVADAVVGNDGNLLGEESTERQFSGGLTSDLKVLAGIEDGDQREVLERLQADSDMMPDSPFLELQAHANNIGFEGMEEYPIGRRSGKVGSEKKVVLAYREKVRERVHYVIYDYKTGKAETSDGDETKFIQAARCTPSTEIYLPKDSEGYYESFIELVRIDRLSRDSVIEKISRVGEHSRKLMQSKRTKNERIVTDMKTIIIKALRSGMITSERSDHLVKLFGSGHVNAWIHKFRDIKIDYDMDGNSLEAVKKMEERSESMRITNRSEDIQESVPDNSRDLNLVGAIFIEPPPAKK